MVLKIQVDLYLLVIAMHEVINFPFEYLVRLFINTINNISRNLTFVVEDLESEKSVGRQNLVKILSMVGELLPEIVRKTIKLMFVAEDDSLSWEYYECLINFSEEFLKVDSIKSILKTLYQDV